MVFLSDVYREPSDLDEARLLRDIAYSRWFTRGWTLQELLAPNTIVFFDCRWSFLGNARDKHMTEAIIKATNIENIFLTDPKHCSVAARMSWAAHRSTTRTEDIAYCLLGLLDVSMPLLYGEGSKAFRRLQEEIIRSSNDESIFAWASDRERFDDSVSYDGILASSPADFVYSVDIVPCHPPRPRPMPYSITNYGLEIDLTYQRDGGPYEDPSSRDIPGWTHWTVPLACRAEKDAGLTGYFRIRLGMASPQIFSNDSQGSMIFRRNPHSITFFKRGEVESQDFPSRKFHIQLSL
ncbi:uncharacterized protein KY384_007944 [Bacidia gigantensis]|uniref:uncharacterized protein n=1 Tax=Bacidia gigantensis TaxID=2732470 RepID=UPI001D03A6E6|nr:uncharacterized protein KY384_007944 [Bacidia gigantensis]KAG8527790.1 hypothetical protein KY384_007944 [Bacidia gigantensis]